MAAQDMEFLEDLTIENGDFKVIESDQQHIEHIITARPGHFYEYPTLGAAKDDLINSSETRQRINQVITENLEQDDYTVKDIIIVRTEDITSIEIDAKRRK
jgi:hypothetical protein